MHWSSMQQCSEVTGLSPLMSLSLLHLVPGICPCLSPHSMCYKALVLCTRASSSTLQQAFCRMAFLNVSSGFTCLTKNCFVLEVSFWFYEPISWCAMRAHDSSPPIKSSHSFTVSSVGPFDSDDSIVFIVTIVTTTLPHNHLSCFTTGQQINSQCFTIHFSSLLTTLSIYFLHKVRHHFFSPDRILHGHHLACHHHHQTQLQTRGRAGHLQLWLPSPCTLCAKPWLRPVKPAASTLLWTCSCV